MKFKLSQNSWHFKLANFGVSSFDRRVSSYGSDICEYIRALFVGTFWFCAASAFVALVASWIGYSLYDLVTVIIYGGIMSPGTILFLIIVLSLSLIAGVAYLHEVYKDRKEEALREAIMKGEYKEPDPSFMTLAYRKFKNKTCFKIEFE